MIITVTPIVEGVAVVGRSTTVTVSTGTVGPTGATGAAGTNGTDGATGPQGDPGEGVPTGGTTGQALVKASGADFDTAWDDVAGGGGAVDSVNGQTGVVVLDADDLADGTTNHAFTASDDTKLAGIATGATANDTDANLKARGNHTGSQAISTVTGLQTALDGKETAGAAATAQTAAEATAASALSTHAGASDPHTGYLKESDYDANTILAAASDNTPAALTVAASRIVGRKSSGDISALTAAEVLTILGISTSSADVQAFTASGTWTKPAGAKLVNVVCIGGGGGGASGRKNTTGATSTGGAGGGGGGYSQATLNPANLGSTVAVTTGAGGAGGTGPTADSTAHASGAAGATSTFGTHVGATGGGGGTSVTGGVVGTGMVTPGVGGTGAGGVSGQAPSAVAAPSGGGGGSGASGGTNSGAPAGDITALGIGRSAGAGAAVDATAGTSQATDSGLPGSGGGGGRGGETTTTTRRHGANGGLYGGGGGGGGGVFNDVGVIPAGNGGNGGSGIVLVVTTF